MPLSFSKNIKRTRERTCNIALVSKMERAGKERIFEEKGWFACEVEEGTVDEECVQQEEAKGNQGMPRELFVFDPHAGLRRVHNKRRNKQQQRIIPILIINNTSDSCGCGLCEEKERVGSGADFGSF